MKELTVHQLIALNAYLIKTYSPKEILGVRDPGALQMCVQSIHASAMGEEVYPSLIDKAGILFINLCKKHCFHNGNKRTAFMSLVLFLKRNGKRLRMDPKEGVEFTVRVATWEGNFDELKMYVGDILKEQVQEVLS